MPPTTVWQQALNELHEADAKWFDGLSEEAIEVYAAVFDKLENEPPESDDLTREVRGAYFNFAELLFFGAKRYRPAISAYLTGEIISEKLGELTEFDKVHYALLPAKVAAVYAEEGDIEEAVYFQAIAVSRASSVWEEHPSSVTKFRAVWDLTLLAAMKAARGEAEEANESAEIATLMFLAVLEDEEVPVLLVEVGGRTAGMLAEVLFDPAARDVCLELSVTVARSAIDIGGRAKQRELDLFIAVRRFGDYCLEHGEYRRLIDFVLPAVEEYRAALERYGYDRKFVYGLFCVRVLLMRAYIGLTEWGEAASHGEWLHTLSEAFKDEIPPGEIYGPAIYYSIALDRIGITTGRERLRWLRSWIRDRLAIYPDDPDTLELADEFDRATAQYEISLD